MLSARIIQVDQFPLDGQQASVRSVPTTIIYPGRIRLVGPLPSRLAAAQLLRAAVENPLPASP